MDSPFDLLKDVLRKIGSDAPVKGVVQEFWAALSDSDDRHEMLHAIIVHWVEHFCSRAVSEILPPSERDKRSVVRVMNNEIANARVRNVARQRLINAISNLPERFRPYAGWTAARLEQRGNQLIAEGQMLLGKGEEKIAEGKAFLQWAANADNPHQLAQNILTEAVISDLRDLAA